MKNGLDKIAGIIADIILLLFFCAFLIFLIPFYFIAIIIEFIIMLCRGDLK